MKLVRLWPRQFPYLRPLLLLKNYNTIMYILSLTVCGTCSPPRRFGTSLFLLALPSVSFLGSGCLKHIFKIYCIFERRSRL